MKWSKLYTLGVSSIDTQHKKLFDLSEQIEELFLLPHHVDKFDEMVAIVNELRNYTMYHFQEEQQHMERVKYPKYFSHLVEHQDFTAKMNDLDLHDLDSSQQQQLRGLIDFIMTWLVDHVLNTDKLFVQYYLNYEKENQ